MNYKKKYLKYKLKYLLLKNKKQDGGSTDEEEESLGFEDDGGSTDEEEQSVGSEDDGELLQIGVMPPLGLPELFLPLNLPNTWIERIQNLFRNISLRLLNPPIHRRVR